MSRTSPTTLLDRGGPPEAPADAPARKPRRLVVELTSEASDSLDELTSREQVNKTTVVNRALKLYRLLRRADAAGGGVYLLTKDGDMERLVFV